MAKFYVVNYRDQNNNIHYDCLIASSFDIACELFRMCNPEFTIIKIKEV